MRQKYRDLSDIVLQQFGIQQCSAPEKPLNWFFEQAIQHIDPFGEQGRGFQDAVILQSIVEHFEQQSCSAVFASDDKKLQESAVPNLRIVTQGEVFANVEARRQRASKAMEKGTLEAIRFNKWELRKRVVEEEFRQHSNQIHAFVQRQLPQVPGLTLMLQTIEEVTSVRILSFESVEVPIPTLTHADDMTATTALIKAAIKVVLLRRMMQMSNILYGHEGPVGTYREQEINFAFGISAVIQWSSDEIKSFELTGFSPDSPPRPTD